MTQRRLLPLFAMLFGLLMPLPAGAQMPHEPQNSVSDKNVALQWHTLPLRHAHPSDILTLMHWDRPKDAQYSFETRRVHPMPFRVTPPPAFAPSIEGNPFLPPGVRRIYALSSSNSLLIEATDQGVDNVRRIVRFLDVAAHGSNPKVSYLIVTEEETGLQWATPPNVRLQIASGPGVTQALDHLLHSGRAMTTVQTIHEYDAREPLAWIVPGYKLGQPRLYSDDSLILMLDPQNAPATATETPHLRRGEAVAIKDFLHPTVTFLKVDY